MSVAYRIHLRSLLQPGKGIMLLLRTVLTIWNVFEQATCVSINVMIIFRFGYSTSINVNNAYG